MPFVWKFGVDCIIAQHKFYLKWLTPTYFEEMNEKHETSLEDM